MIATAGSTRPPMSNVSASARWPPTDRTTRRESGSGRVPATQPPVAGGEGGAVGAATGWVAGGPPAMTSSQPAASRPGSAPELG